MARGMSTTPEPWRSTARRSSPSGRGRHRSAVHGRRPDRCDRLRRHSRAHQHAHPRADGAVPRPGGRPARCRSGSRNTSFPAEAKTVSREMVRVGTRLAALEMIQSGTTAYADMYYFEEEIARVTKAAGMRGVLGQTIIQFPVPDAKTPQEGLARAEAFIKEFAERRADRSGRRAARALHARCQRPARVARAGDEIRRAGADSCRRDGDGAQATRRRRMPA